MEKYFIPFVLAEMADAFTPDLFSEFKRTASPQPGRSAGKRGRGFGKRGRGGVKHRSVNTPQEVLVPDLTPEVKRKRRNTSDTIGDIPTTSQSVTAVSDGEQQVLVNMLSSAATSTDRT